MRNPVNGREWRPLWRSGEVETASKRQNGIDRASGAA
jgi:hypothetical protein